MHILNMMFIMTYNGYVCIVLIVGMALGYTIFGMNTGKDKTIPVNCCAWFEWKNTESLLFDWFFNINKR